LGYNGLVIRCNTNCYGACLVWFYGLVRLTRGIALTGEAPSTLTDVVHIHGAVTLAILGILAYLFGLRHGLDADHLAAIDNSTRKLVQERKRSLFTGTFFSLGHSTVVVLMAIALTVATRYIVKNLASISETHLRLNNRYASQRWFPIHNRAPKLPSAAGDLRHI
jgi:High-affinity nickel permease